MKYLSNQMMAMADFCALFCYAFRSFDSTALGKYPGYRIHKSLHFLTCLTLIPLQQFQDPITHS